MGIIALTPLKYGTHGTRWQDNIFCQYVGRVLPLTTAERGDYRSDYLLGWPQHGEAVDGQLENKGSIGHLINDDFTRDGGSLEAHRDSRTGKSYLCLTEDLNPGDEPSFPYGIDFWTAHLMQLPSLSRRSCIQKYRIPLRTLTALGLDPNGFETAAHDVQASAPAQESSTGLLRQTSLDNWRLRATFPHPDNGIECKATLKPPINTILTCELPLNGSTATQAAAPDPETLGLGTVWRRSLGRGELVHEGTLRSEDDSRMRTHTILAEFPPPPPATRHTESQSMALWGKGLLSVSVKLAQESPQEGDQPGMGDLAHEEALCRLDDSLLRTHPMLDVPPTPLPASPPVNSLAPDAPLPRAPPKPSNTTILPCDLPLNVTSATQAAAQDPETLGLGSEWRRLLGWGELDHEGTLRSEDDSRLRTHTILAECPPPPPATRHTESQSMALWDKGLLSVSVKLAQEPSHVGVLLGMGDLADEEALCRMNDSLPRTHPMLAVHSHLCTLWRLLLHH